MTVKTMRKGGREYVILPRPEYDRLVQRSEESQLPDLPKADSNGNYPALEFLRVSIARDIIRDRVAAGLNQKELAERAGIRVETLCRIETGKHTASVATIDKIDRILRSSSKTKKRR